MRKTATTRLCERATIYGMETLSDTELLSISTGISRNQLQEILDRYSIYEVISLLDRLGLNANQKMQLEALFQISSRISRAQYQGGVTIRSHLDIGMLFVKELQFKTVEVVMIALLDVHNCLIRIETVSKGTVSMALICPREVARVALSHNAAHVIIAHGHPSGSTTPSLEDIETTRKLAEALDLLSISLLDHIIVGGNSFTSLKQVGHF